MYGIKWEMVGNGDLVLRIINLELNISTLIIFRYMQLDKVLGVYILFKNIIMFVLYLKTQKEYNHVIYKQYTLLAI